MELLIFAVIFYFTARIVIWADRLGNREVHFGRKPVDPPLEIKKCRECGAPQRPPNVIKVQR